ncbi:MAG: helix-turn-helix domain-containing protein [Oscillospiraceae bacterium]|nr:helix-turn-helix domain-containing protein [Oscillospiraceae bacterium]
MNKDFPRVMKLLRKERGLRQKEAAEQLGIAQALLSHYENGKRECGLDFLVTAANFYGVSIDYILGRTSSRNGTVVVEDELPESTVSESYEGAPSGAGTLLRKKLATNSLEVVFSLLMKTKNTKLAKAISSYILTAVYRAYRMVYSAGGQNDENSFAVPIEEVSGLCVAKLSIDNVRVRAASKEGTEDERITNARIEHEYPKQSAALFSVVTNVERELLKLN